MTETRSVIRDVLIFAAGTWGMYWYAKAHRAQDAIQYMVEDELELEEHVEAWKNDM
jgi:hypothetical protein